MKKKSFAIVLCFGALLILLLAYLGLKSYNEKQEEGEETESEISVIELNEEEITGISYQYQGEEIAFEKVEDSWYYKADHEFPVNQESITTLLGNFTSISAERNIGKPDSLQEYGLEEPANTIVLTMQDDTKKTFCIGNLNATSNTYYLYADSPDTVYTVSSTVVSAVDKNLYDYAKTETFPAVTAGDVTKVDIQQSDKQIELYSMEDDSGIWKVLGTDAKEVEADSTKTADLTGTLSSMYYQSFVDYKDSNMAQYGMDKPVLTLRVDYKEIRMDEEEQTITEKKDFTLVVGSKTESGEYYVKLADSKQIYTMSEEHVKPWIEASYESLIKAE